MNDPSRKLPSGFLGSPQISALQMTYGNQMPQESKSIVWHFTFGVKHCSLHAKLFLSLKPLGRKVYSITILSVWTCVSDDVRTETEHRTVLNERNKVERRDKETKNHLSWLSGVFLGPTLSLTFLVQCCSLH